MAAGNASFNTFVSSTLRNYRPGMIENLITHQALFWQLKQRGMMTEEQGGRSIVETLMYGQNNTVQSYSGFDAFNLSPQLGFTQSEYDWKFFAGAVSISGEEEFKNSGSKSRIFSLIKGKVRQLDISFRIKLNAQLFADGTGNGGKDITGLALAVEDGAAWSTYGGIDSSDADNSWWRNQYIDFDSTYGATSVFNDSYQSSVKGLAALRRMKNNCSIQGSSPTLIVTTQDIYEAYDAYMEGTKQRIPLTGGAGKLADAGFQTLEFGGIPMIWDSVADSESILFLNSDYLKLVTGAGRNFNARPFADADNQDARFSVTLWAGNLVCSKRDQQGRVTGVTV